MSSLLKPLQIQKSLDVPKTTPSKTPVTNPTEKKGQEVIFVREERPQIYCFITLKDRKGGETRPTKKIKKKEPKRRDEPKRRVRLNSTGTKFLEKVFENEKYPTTDRAIALSLRLGVSVKFVQQWFQNKRARERRKGSKIFKEYALE